jgi:hypothetical protein
VSEAGQGVGLPSASGPPRPLESEFIYNDLDAALAHPDNVCAVVSTDVHLEGPGREAALECIGSEDLFAPSVGTQRLDPTTLERRVPRQFPVRLEEGVNPVQALSCDRDGDWYFACAVVDENGRSLDEARSREPEEARLDADANASAEPAASRQGGAFPGDG